MADIKISEIRLRKIRLRKINATLVATNQDILKMGEPIAIKQADGSFTLKIGDGVNKIKDLKSISESELAEYVKKTTFEAHANSTSNPHSVTKEQVGLGNVDNTSDANKPISTATQTALNDKISLLGNETVSGQPYHFTYYYKVDVQTNKIVVTAKTITLDNTKTLADFPLEIASATSTTAGLMSANDKDKLDNLGDTFELKANKVTAIRDAATAEDTKYPSEKAARTELNKRIELLGNEAVSGLPYNIPYHFAFTQNEDNIEIKIYTITVDNNKTLNTWTSTLPSATTLKAGLMSKDDKVKLDSINPSLYQLKSNLVSAFQTTPDDTHYISEKLAKDELDKKQDKLPEYVADKYLKVVEDPTTHELKLVWAMVSAVPGSTRGDYFTSSLCDTMDKVQDHFGDDKTTTYWVLLNYDNDYYQWLRTDIFPKFSSFVGMRVFNILNTVEEVMDYSSSHYYAGTDWNKLYEGQFVCVDNTGYANPGDADYIKQKLFADDYVAVNINDIDTDNDYATTSEDILSMGTLLKYVNALGNNAFKFSDGVTKVLDLTEMTIESDLIAKEKIYLSAIYDVTDWDVLDNAILTGVIQAVAKDGTMVEGQGESFVGMIVINKITSATTMHTRYEKSGTETSNWEILNPDEAASGHLSQWLRNG